MRSAWLMVGLGVLGLLAPGCERFNRRNFWARATQQMSEEKEEPGGPGDGDAPAGPREGNRGGGSPGSSPGAAGGAPGPAGAQAGEPPAAALPELPPPLPLEVAECPWIVVAGEPKVSGWPDLLPAPAARILLDRANELGRLPAARILAEEALLREPPRRSASAAWAELPALPPGRDGEALPATVLAQAGRPISLAGFLLPAGPPGLALLVPSLWDLRRGLVPPPGARVLVRLPPGSSLAAWPRAVVARGILRLAMDRCGGDGALYGLEAEELVDPVNRE